MDEKIADLFHTFSVLPDRPEKISTVPGNSGLVDTLGKRAVTKKRAVIIIETNDTFKMKMKNPKIDQILRYTRFIEIDELKLKRIEIEFTSKNKS